MSIPTYAVFVKDFSSSVRFEVAEEFLTSGRSIEFPPQKAKGFENHFWQVRIICFNHNNIFEFRLQKKRTFLPSGYVELTLTIEGIAREFEFDNDFYDDKDHRSYTDKRNCFKLHELRQQNAVKDGKVIMTIKSKSSIPVCQPILSSIAETPANMDLSYQQYCHREPDFTFLFDDGQSLKVHKEYISNISPVFKAMFAHDTKERRSGVLEIRDFDYGTVKGAVDFLYGRLLASTSLSHIIGMLRFVDKYIMTSAVNQLKEWLVSNYTADDLDKYQKVEELLQH